MSNHDNIEKIQQIYAAFGRGDVPTVVDAFAERLEHFGVESHGPVKAPWHCSAATRADVAEYFQKLLGTLEPLKFEVENVAAGGDYVYATTQQQFRVRANGNMLVLRNSVHRFKLVQGRIVGWMATEDTQRTVEALR